MITGPRNAEATAGRSAAAWARARAAAGSLRCSRAKATTWSSESGSGCRSRASGSPPRRKARTEPARPQLQRSRRRPKPRYSAGRSSRRAEIGSGGRTAHFSVAQDRRQRRAPAGWSDPYRLTIIFSEFEEMVCGSDGSRDTSWSRPACRLRGTHWGAGPLQHADPLGTAMGGGLVRTTKARSNHATRERRCSPSPRIRSSRGKSASGYLPPSR